MSCSTAEPALSTLCTVRLPHEIPGLELAFQRKARVLNRESGTACHTIRARRPHLETSGVQEHPQQRLPRHRKACVGVWRGLRAERECGAYTMCTIAPHPESASRSTPDSKHCDSVSKSSSGSCRRGGHAARLSSRCERDRYCVRLSRPPGGHLHEGGHAGIHKLPRAKQKMDVDPEHPGTSIHNPKMDVERC